MCSGAVTRREGLAGYDERRRVRPKVLEEVSQAVEEDEGFRAVRNNRAEAEAL